MARCQVAAAAQHQRLIEGVLEAMVPLFRITIFIRLTRLGFLAIDPVMTQQPFVCSCELSSVN
jgi:hypothetical protein